jgi:SHS2 domain-containing protein
MMYEELEHTADVKVRIKAATLDGLFAEAAHTLMNVMYGDDIRKGNERREITVQSADFENLMQEFLSEVLFLSEVDNLVFSSVIVHITNLTLQARLTGEPFEPSRHTGGTEVKGISYSGLRIFQEGAGYIVELIFDV